MSSTLLLEFRTKKPHTPPMSSFYTRIFYINDVIQIPYIIGHDTHITPLRVMEVLSTKIACIIRGHCTMLWWCHSLFWWESPHMHLIDWAEEVTLRRDTKADGLLDSPFTRGRNGSLRCILWDIYIYIRDIKISVYFLIILCNFNILFSILKWVFWENI